VTASGTLIQVEPPPSYDEAEFISRLRDVYNQAKETKGSMLNEWKRNYRVTMNRAAPAVPAAPGTRANETFPTVDSRIAWMTDQEIQFSITAACDPFSMYSMVSDTLGEQLESVLNSTMRSDDWDGEITKMLWDAAMYGAGFLKCVWDSGLTEGMGNVALKCTSPWCLYVDPYATDLEDAQYIIEVHTMSAAEIERRYPDTTQKMIHDATLTGDTDRDHLPPNQVTNRQKQAGALIPVDAGQGATTWGAPGSAKQHTNSRQEGVNVYEFWLRENYEEDVEPTDPSMGDEPRKVVIDQWRVVVMSGNRILLDELAENLFHTNRHPYVRYVDVETGEFWGSPILRDLAPCQQAMNTLLAMGQNNIIYTGNPVVIGVKGSGADRTTWMNKPGQIYDVNSSPGQSNNRPEWLQPPNLPPALIQFVQFWREEMERIAGLSATNKGEVPSGRATDKQVQAGQEAGFIRIRSAIRNLERTLRKAGELLANLVIINYDVPRFVAIVGDEGEMSSIRLAAQHFYAPTVDYKNQVTFAPLRFTMLVNAGSSKPTSRAARIQEANTLKQMNVVDDQYVLQAYRVSHWKAVQQRKQAQQQMEMQLAQAQAAAGQSAGKGGGSPKRQPSQAPKPGG
jgi:hypothetical protein